MNEKQENIIQFKSEIITDIDIQDREVKGYLASFNNIDSDSDMFKKGAFMKSIQEHGVDTKSNRKITHLAYHDTTRPIGNFTELKEDDKGLYFTSILGTHTDGQDFLKMYKEGIIREHSVGFQYIPSKMFKKKDEAGTEFYELTEVKLWEGSAVVFGANSETPNLTSIKSQSELNSELEKLNERMEVFIKALTDKNISEKYNNMFEFELQSIQKMYNFLAQKQSFNDTVEENKTDIEENIVINNKKRFLY